MHVHEVRSSADQVNALLHQDNQICYTHANSCLQLTTSILCTHIEGVMCDCIVAVFDIGQIEMQVPSYTILNEILQSDWSIERVYKCT